MTDQAIAAAARKAGHIAGKVFQIAAAASCWYWVSYALGRHAGHDEMGAFITAAVAFTSWKSR